MPLKKAKKAWYDEAAKKFGFKFDNVTKKGNVVCKKLSAKSLKELKAAGYKVGKIPCGSFVIFAK